MQPKILLKDALNEMTSSDRTHYQYALADIYAHLFHFWDVSLIYQVLLHSKLDKSQLNEAERIVLAAQGSARYLRPFLSLLENSNITNLNQVLQLCDILSDSNVRIWFRTSFEAVLMDSFLSSAEGEYLEINAEKGLYDLVLEIHQSAKRHNQELLRRHTPFATPTDDSQFLASGLIAAIYRPANFASQVVINWKTFDQLNIWRNTGRRTKRFLKGEKHAFQGGVRLGDFLRWYTLAPFVLSKLAEPEQRQEEFTNFCNILHCSHEQIIVGLRFMDYLGAKFSGNADLTGEAFDKLLEHVKTYSRTNFKFWELVRAHLIDDTDPMKFMKEAQRIGKDQDTYGFLAAIFSVEPMLSKKDYLFLNPTHARYFELLFNAALEIDPTSNGDAGSIARYLSCEASINHKLAKIRGH